VVRQAPQGQIRQSVLLSSGVREAILGEPVDFEWERLTDKDSYVFGATNMCPRRGGPQCR